MKVWVLTKETLRGSHPEDGGAFTVMAVYARYDNLLARVNRIAAANSQYELRKLGANCWIFGPDDDEGFFGNRPVQLRAFEVVEHNEEETP